MAASPPATNRQDSNCPARLNRNAPHNAEQGQDKKSAGPGDHPQGGQEDAGQGVRRPAPGNPTPERSGPQGAEQDAQVLGADHPAVIAVIEKHDQQDQGRNRRSMGQVDLAGQKEAGHRNQQR